MRISLYINVRGMSAAAILGSVVWGFIFPVPQGACMRSSCWWRPLNQGFLGNTVLYDGKEW